ncbi:tape measure protein [Moraxella catarrhalis]|uniref:tape measure protein n=1 Tax=Moraxella catarrhalis TaxID=480 RepID=UPI001604A962|nr:tape measure protein [Moraxella catarrhalis]
MSNTHRLDIQINTGDTEQRLARLKKSFDNFDGAEKSLAKALDGLNISKDIKQLINVINKLGSISNKAGGNSKLLQQQINQTAKRSNELERALKRSNTEIDRLGRAFQKSQQDASKMANALAKANAKIDELTKKSKQAKNATDSASSSIEGLKKTLDRIKGVMGASIFGLGIMEVLQTADAMKTLDTQIKLVTNSEKQYLAVKSEISQIANRTRQDIASTIDAYTNNARSLSQLGKTQAEVLKFTENISMAMAVGGKSAMEQSAALLQLGQAMQSGVLQGDEFRSIAENAPILLDLIAKNLGKSRTEVKKLASDGKITSEVIYQSLAGATDELKEKFKSMPVTMSQAMTVLKNRYTEAVDKMINASGGIGEQLAKGILWASDNFSSLSSTLVGLTAIFGVYMAVNTKFVAVTLPALVSSTVASVGAFHAQSLAMNANIASALTLASAKTKLNGALAATVGAAGSASKFLITKTKSVGAASLATAKYGIELVKTNGLIGAMGVAARNTAGIVATKAKAVGASTVVTGALSGAVKGLSGVVMTLGRSLLALASTLLAHPIITLAAVISGIIVATMGLENAMENFGDTVHVVGMIISDFVKWAVDGLSKQMTKAIDFMAKFFGDRSKDGANNASKSFADFFGKTEQGFLGVVQVIAGAFDNIYTVVRASVDYVGVQVDNLLIKAKNAKNKLLPEALGGGGVIMPENNASFESFLSLYRGGAGALAYVNSKIAIRRSDKQNSVSGDYLTGGGFTPSATTPANSQKKKQAQEEGLSTQNGRMFMVYTAAKSAGFSDEQARQLTAQVGRENDYRTEHLFGAHRDANNGLKNIGMISWQGDRAKKLWRELEQQGFIKKGKIVQTQEALNYQAKFLAREMANDPEYARTRHDFMQNPNPEYNVGMGALNDNFIRWDSAGKNAVPRHEKQKNYYEQISNLTKNFVEETQNQAELLEQANDFLLQFSSMQNRLMKERDRMIKEAQKYLGVSSEDQVNAMINFANDRYEKQVQLLRLETDYEINAHRLSAQERMALEYEIYDLKITLNQDYTAADKSLMRESAKEKYQAEYALFLENEQRKREEWEKTIKNHGLDYIRQAELQKAGYTSIAQQKTLEMQFRHSDARNDLNEQYKTLLQDSVGAKDDNGNFLLSESERLQKIEELRQKHLDALKAMEEVHAEEMKQLESEHLSHKLQTYGAVASGFANLFKGMVGEQSKAYRVMFAASKAYALADVGVKMGKAVADAWADPSAVTIWQKLANVAKVSLEQGHVLSMINAISPKGFATGGYTGNMGINQVAGVVHGQEYVLNAKATKRIGVSNLERLNRGDGIGGHVNNISVNVTVNSDGSSVQADTQMGKTMGEAMAKIARQVVIQESKQNGHLDRLYRR